MEIRVGGLDVEDRVAVANAIRRQADRFQELADTYDAEGVDPGDGPRLRRKVEMMRAVAQAFLEAPPPPVIVWKALDAKGRSILTVPITPDASLTEVRARARHELSKAGRSAFLERWVRDGERVELQML